LFDHIAISTDLEAAIKYKPARFKFNKKQKRIKTLSIFRFFTKISTVKKIEIKNTIK
jgi:hypothetical protein